MTEQGNWAIGADVTIADVADRAQVSIRTVSRVINGSPKVNAETRAKIVDAIAALGFRPSARARGLATGRSYLIGMIHNDGNVLVLGDVHRCVANEATAQGCEVIAHATLTGQDGSVEDVLDFVRRSRVDGVVILAPVSGVPGLADALRTLGIPAVALSSVRLPGFDAMLVSGERHAAVRVAEHIVALGHRRVAHVSGPPAMLSAQERRAGFLSALAAAGVALVGEEAGDYSFESGVAAAERLLSIDPTPTAIFAANDIMAAGVIKVAASRRLVVPRDLTVIGFDGSLLARMIVPALTTVQRPMGEMAQMAARCLFDIIAKRPVDTLIEVDLPLLIAESSAPPPA
ncbi:MULTISPECIES: LacI family DNA-binding transcriptional regulator [unclassified Sphingobium]|uniref:LacI family DNA-binding transcriptional regulator n=1 Tax=unclassified Sphingobium TaxID=2611147 RepID=UPI000D170215|nr:MULTISPECIES: LacI family DNA-binding transcriptional regulator [unclassified Sphingobium]MBG6117879.1 LacI family transcriptional regulator [Sphingobium sp. JAI105]PSO12295.1 LacI family transcriptional regulator [Sphingobium sp. AEW4]TWD08522.1 LacI family transcriptional regulator [Sphingobium sp. AEW010]TWD25846.1 LacI family transcriptional regulator [Sphingobium sp. AEW013]TWD28318.1 LacI family transcriptional regulator [Sphingobium sp. AEW001]